MERKSYIKNQIRIIGKTKARFFSIFIIVFLGAAFYAGLRHTPQIMENSISTYLKEYRFNDLEYIATLGFSQADIDSIKDVEGIDQIDVGYRFDALLTSQGSTNGVTVFTSDSYPTSVNSAEIVEGRLPSTDNECAMDYQMQERYDYSMGQVLTLKNDQGEKEFTIVGFVNDSRFISDIERGTNTLGDGSNNGFIEIVTGDNSFLALPQSLLDLRNEQTLYNDVRITLKNKDEYNLFSEEYESFVKETNYEIKNILTERYNTLYEDVTQEAKDQLAIYQGEYDTNLETYNTQLAAFNVQITDAKVKLTNAKIELVTNQQKLLESKELLNSANDTALGELEKINEELSALKLQLEALKENVSSTETTQEETTESDPSNRNQAIDNIALALSNVQISLGTVNTVIGSNLELEKASLELDKALLEIQKNENQLTLEELGTTKQFEDSKSQLDQAKIQLDNTNAQIDTIPKGNVITLTASENAGIVSFSANSDAIASLSLLFPLIFFLVAALVSLTTMTRMVEEQRVQSGTLRALGYSKKDVIVQYLIYAFFATFIASTLGMIFGIYFFPSIIYFLYRTMMYDVGAMVKIGFDAMICLQTFIISVAIIMVVTFIVCYQELGDMPSTLLRPKAPKSGKRIVLERISFIWSRLSFNQKVTMRNIFRYKKRFFMSIIGIAGCTALIVTGIGIKESVSSVADKQYGDVWKYDGILNYNNEHIDNTIEQVEDKISKREEVKSLSSFYMQTIEILGEDKTYYGNLEVPKNSTDFEKFVNLNSFQDGTPLHLNDTGVMISAKLAELLDVGVDDSISINLEGTMYEVPIDGVFESYFMHYMYMSKTYYENITGIAMTYSGAYYAMSDTSKKHQDALTTYVDDQEELSGISFVNDTAENFRTQMSSVDSVVVILIICAAALAFVVLYNLTNINIQERKSEIATVKVLGFYPKEVYDYVFRENILLAFLGSLVGLVFGKLIHMYLIRTVELEVTMFVRELSYVSYVIAIILTMAFTMFINLVMRRVLKKIDMVESLKSIE